jgi:hypothetical protein
MTPRFRAGSSRPLRIANGDPRRDDLPVELILVRDELDAALHLVAGSTQLAAGSEQLAAGSFYLPAARCPLRY